MRVPRLAQRSMVMENITESAKAAVVSTTRATPTNMPLDAEIYRGAANSAGKAVPEETKAGSREGTSAAVS